MSIEEIKGRLCESIALQEKGLQESKAALAALGNAKDEVKPAIKAFIAGEPPESPPIIKIPDSVVVEKGQSLQDACSEAKGGSRCVVVPKGMVMPAQKISGIGDKPFWLRAEEPGGSAIVGLIGKKNWKHEGDGIYVTDHSGEPYAGTCDGKFLFRYGSPERLRAGRLSIKNSWEKKASDVKKPEYGFAAGKGKVWLRLPGRANPNETEFRLTNGFNQVLLQADKSSGLIVDGLFLSGAGASSCIEIARNSPGAMIRNCVFDLSRFGGKIPDNTLAEWNEFSFDGFYNFNDELLDMNGGDFGSVFKLVKVEFANKHGNAHLESAIFISHEQPSSRVECRDNYANQCFDMHRFGRFKDSKFVREVSNYCYDDGGQFEAFHSRYPASNLTVEDSLFLNSGGSGLSHQDKGGQMDGPHTVRRTVIATTDPKHSHPAYAIKAMITGNPEIVYDQCLIHVPVKPQKSGWGAAKFLYLDKKDSGAQHVSISNSVVVMGKIDDWDEGTGAKASGNLLFSRKQDTDIQGKGGVYAGSDPKKLFPGWQDMNTAPADLNFAPSKDIQKGPFKPGDKMPWRPLKRAFSDAVPERWEG